MERLSIIGSTGSIGKTTLSVIRNNPKAFKVLALAACNNIRLIEKQAIEFKPKIVAIWEEEKALLLKKRLRSKRTKVVHGIDGLIEVATISGSNKIVFALSGIVGLIPLLESIKKKKNIAIANKEVLVIAGDLITREVKKAGVQFIPIDSEHSAIFQCIQGHSVKDIRKIILTASGGPFVDRSYDTFHTISTKEALNHPRWKMGRKITIDSATMMNKGLEVIEAARLYGMSVDSIDVIIHKESLIHSLVEYHDGSVLAQLSNTDMYFPISFALSYPDRLPYEKQRLDLIKNNILQFSKPDYNKFKCLSLAYKAGRVGGTMTTVLNAANEIAVDLFLRKKIVFTDISKHIAEVMARHRCIKKPTLNTILQTDAWAREEVLRLC